MDDQPFQLVAPHARLIYAYEGEIGEALFGGFAKTLVRLLAVPVRPSHTIDPKQAPVKRRHRVSAVKCKAGAETSQSPPRLRNKTNYGNSQPATLFSLPTELHLLIFFHLKYIEDVISLGFAYERLYDIAREELRIYFCRHLGPWAGQKIAFVGEDANDFPPGLFSDAELKALTIKVYNEETCQNDIETPSDLYDFTTPGVSRIYDRSDMFYDLVHLLFYFHNLDRSFKLALLHSMCPDCVPKQQHFPMEYFPIDQPWILRNLTTKQFIRADAIALKPEFIQGPNIKVLGFGEVVLSRICWSSVAAEDLPNIHRGIWAGHCFDIIPLAQHQDETSNGRGWTDASDEVAKEIAVLWEGRYGTNWREILCQGP